ncbi:Pr6Pr family membrane protein [Schumannella luteola]
MTAALRILLAVAMSVATVKSYLDAAADWAANDYPDRLTLNVNFVAYFTIQSNVLGAVVLVIAAILLLRRGGARGGGAAGAEPSWLTTLRLIVLVDMTITGIVYNVLLRGIAVHGGGSGPDWPSEIHHVVAPALIIVDWLVGPGRGRVPWSRLWLTLIHPLAWAAVALLRGPLVYDQTQSRQSWYPYPFLDPALSPTGYASVWIYVVGIALLFAVVAALGILVTRIRRRGPARPSAG